MQRVTAFGLMAAAIAITGCSDAAGPVASDGTPAASVVPASAPAPGTSTSKYEIKFMKDMIDHHAMAIMTAEICVQKAVHEELRTLCEQIIAAQSEEIETMQGWLSDWYGITYEPQMKPRDQKMIDRLEALSGSEFEIEFMQMMIEHHEAAIKAARDCLRKAYHPELIELCENIIAAQQAEIEQMQTWLCDWYSICE